MASRDSSSSSSKPSSSRSGPQQQRQHQHLDRHEEHRTSSKTNDVASAGFDPDTRSKIMNITKIPPPSLMEEKDRNGGSEHPLLYLHQSVSGDNKKGTGGLETNVNMSQQRQQPQKIQRQHIKPSNERKLNEASEKIISDQPKPEKKDDEKDILVKRNERSLASVLFKTLATIALVILWISLMNSVISQNSSIEESAPKILLDLSAGIAAAQLGTVSYVQELSQHIIALLPPFGSKRDLVSIEQFEKRLELGLNLLRKYDDASGSAATCESTLHAIVDSQGEWRDESVSEFLSMVSSSLAIFGANENRLISKALLCLGEARLALFSSSFGSQAIKRGHLMNAKESFEAATAVDPADPSVRSGLGLSFLLLGMIKDNEDDDDSVQFTYQSIQHLKAAVLLTSESGSGETDEGISVHNAAMYNLGLAYVALDGKSPSGASDVAKSTHFLDWVSLLRSSQAPHSVLESRVFSANEGTMLLQLGKFEDAISSLESTASEVCSDSLTSLSSRQSQVCLIVQQNLAVARDALRVGQEEPSIHARLEGGSAIHDKVAQWNTVGSYDLLSTAATDPDSSEDINDAVPSDGIVFNTTDDSEEKSETSVVTEETEMDGTHVEVEVKVESNDFVDDETKSSDLEQAKEDEVSIVPSTPMQNALAALEKAAEKGTQRTRLLLALARARSSSGDITGAVDAALKAINAATSEEETETSTSYLESLMEKMAGEGSDETMEVISQEHSLENQKDISTFVESKDFALSELTLKLELERLKYKVLEQEMMLGRYKSPPQHDTYRNPPHPDLDIRAIDYQEEVGRVARVTRQHSDVVEETETTVEREDTQQHDGVIEETTKLSPEQDTTVHVIQEEPTQIVDDVIESDPEAVLHSETGDASHEESIANQTLLESQNGTNTKSLPKTAGTKSAESDENKELLGEGATDIDGAGPYEDIVPVVEPIQLPSLFAPSLKPPAAIPPTAKSYMKMADAYLDKGNYALASKQFLKVIKKAAEHLPAHLGYATALERAGKSKQIKTAALAYGNATKVAIIQSERVDPMAKAGAGGIAENILKRAVQLAKSAPIGKERIETLQTLSTYAHTAALAGDIYYEIGTEIVKQDIGEGDKRDGAMQAFAIANEFVGIRNDTESPYHIASMVELGKIALEHENNAIRVIDIFDQVKNVHMENDAHVELLVLVGRAHASLGKFETAITEFSRALSFPQSSSTPSAHQELAITLKKSGGDTHEINLHFEKALDMGMDPTTEALEALGEHNMSVMKALNRQYYKNYNSGSADNSGGGGIMSGGGVGSQSSVFAPKQNEEKSAQSETLNLLEQGAAAYDGNSPMGGEVEGTESNLSNLKVKKQQGSESNLSNLRR